MNLNAKTLAKALAPHKGVVAKNPLAPIFENYRLEVKGDVLGITSSNLNLKLVTTMSLDAPADDLLLTLPAAKLDALLANLGDQTIELRYDQANFATTIATATGKYKLVGQNPSDFPTPKPLSEANVATFPVDSLATAIARTRPYVSTDGLRPAMCGVYFEPAPDGVNLVTTDGHRLAVCLAEEAQLEGSFILPAEAVSVLRSLLTYDAFVEIHVGANRVMCSGNNWQLFAQVIDERYPDYQNAVPTDNPIVAIVDRKTFISALKRVMVLANSIHQIKVNFSADEISLKAEDLDYGQEAADKLSCTCIGGDLRIGFNARYLLEVLSSMTADELTLEASVPMRAMIIRESPASWALIMPVHLYH